MVKYLSLLFLLLASCGDNLSAPEYEDAGPGCGYEGQKCCEGPNIGIDFWCHTDFSIQFEKQVICRNWDFGGTLNGKNYCERRDQRIHYPDAGK